MEDIERQLAAATLRAVRRGRGAPQPPPHPLPTSQCRHHLRPAQEGRARTPGGGPSSCSATSGPDAAHARGRASGPPLDQPVRLRAAAARPVSRGADGRRGALDVMLGTDEVRGLRAQALRGRRYRRRSYAALKRRLTRRRRSSLQPRALTALEPTAGRGSCRPPRGDATISNAFCGRPGAPSTASMCANDVDFHTGTTASTRGAPSRPAAHRSSWAPGTCEDNLACGRGTCGQLGLGSGRCGTTRPTRLALGRRVASVAAGAHHSLCVCDDGSLWAWGKAADHQLGTRVDDVMAPAPARVRLEGDLRARQVAAARGALLARRRRGRGPLELGPQRARPAGPRHGAAVARAATRVLPLRAARRAGRGRRLPLAGRAARGRALRLRARRRRPARPGPPAQRDAAGDGAAAPVRAPGRGRRDARACCDSAGCLYTWGDGAKGALGHLGPRPRKNKNDTGLASMPSWESALRFGEALQHSAGAAPAA